MAETLTSYSNDTAQVSLYKIANNFYVLATGSGYSGSTPNPGSSPQELLNLIVDHTSFMTGVVVIPEVIPPVVIPPEVVPGLSIWSDSSVPAIVDVGEDGSVEIGLKFSADVAGTITAIRFYKADTNVGPRAVNLWSIGGSLLGTGTSSGETASGWQQVDLATPVTIVASTLYVASYHCSAGHYSATGGAFNTVDFVNSPLRAIGAGAGQQNGVFGYGASSVFPNQSFNNTNYWVDVVFYPT